MNIEDLMGREDFSTMSPLEIQYLLADDEHKEAFALGVSWALNIYARGEVDEILLWAERAGRSLIMDGDEVVGLADFCPG